MGIGEHGGELKAALATATTYAASGSLVVGDYMQFLNNNAGAFGVFLGFATYFTNLYFKVKQSRRVLIDDVEEK